MATLSAMTKTLSARIEIDRDEMRGLNDGKSLKIGDRSITAPNPKSRAGCLGAAIAGRSFSGQFDRCLRDFRLCGVG